MGLEIINRVYTDARGRTGDTIQNNVFNLATARYDVEYTAKLDLSQYVSVIKDGDKFTLTTGTWAPLINAFNGANIDFVFSNLDTATPITTTIAHVDGAEMTLTSGGTSADGIKSVGYFQVTDAPELFEFYFNLVQNSIGGTKFSIIDNETNRFEVVLVNGLTPGGTDNLVQLGKKSGGATMTGTIEQLTVVDGNKRYSIIINYRNWAAFNSALFDADDCVGDYALIRATPSIGRENVFVEVENKQLGNTGFEDEAFNGGASDYEHVSTVWTDDAANVMAAMDHTKPSNFVITINGTFIGADQYNIYLSRFAADASEYSKLELPFENNIMLCTSATLIDDGVATAISGFISEDSEAFNISGFEVTDNTTSITVVGKITPTPQMTELIESKPDGDKRYKLSILCEDSTLTNYNTANTDNVLCDFQDSVKDVIPLGNYPDIATLIMVGDDNVTLGSSPALLTESYNRISSTFTLPKDSNKDNPWISLTGRITAERTTGETFQYEAFTYDISQLIPIQDGTLCTEYTQTRGKQLPAGSLFNEVTFTRKPGLDTGLVFGIGLDYGFRVGFETWLDVPQVSSDFKNKDNDWYQVSSEATWQLKFELLIEHENGIYTDDLDFSVDTYDAGTGVGVFTFENEDAVAATKPLVDLTEVTYTYTGTANYIGNESGIISVRDFEGNVLSEISTIEDPLVEGNPFTPITGETRLKITVALNVITLVCLLETSILNNTGTTRPITLVPQIKGDV